jgi:glucose/arabinose dehydrogenase
MAVNQIEHDGTALRSLFHKIVLAACLVAGVMAVIQAGPDRTGAQAARVPIEKLKLPPGFKIAVFAEGVSSARAMTLGAKGTVFVGSMNSGKVFALVDQNGDHKIDPGEMKIVANGLTQPTGVAFRNGSLYVAAATRIVRLDDIENKLDTPPAAVTVRDGLPSQHHTWKFLAFGPDGLMYVNVGSPCNVCERLDNPQFSTILRMKPDGTNVEIFAHGVRNSVGFDWHPDTHDLWFTDNGRDELGDDLPNDELNVAPTPRLHFGFPYCHQGDTPDPDFGAKRPCSDFVPPAQKLGPHVAAIGMRFYSGTMFPREYHNAIFIAEHGSWNRSVPIGYRVMVAKVDGRKVTGYEPFVEGWLQGTKSQSPRGATADTFGRPADVLVLPDGSLLISDDFGGRIYRVTYGR